MTVGKQRSGEWDKNHLDCTATNRTMGCRTSPTSATHQQTSEEEKKQGSRQWSWC